MIKHFAIRRHYSYFETDNQAIANDDFDKNLEALDKEIEAVYQKYGVKLISYDTRFIPSEKMSVTHCEQCGNLMINRDNNPMRFNKEQHFLDLDVDCNMVIWDGGNFEGKQLCMECLPITHRWGYSS